MNNLFKLLTISLFAIVATSCGKTKDYSEDYKKAVKENDFEKAHDILGEIHDNFEQVWNDNFPGLDYDNDNRTKIEVAATEYARAASYILGAEVRYLISEKPDIANDRIEYLLDEIVTLGEKVNEGAGYHPGGVPKYQEICVKFDCYKQTVKYNNEVCDIVLNLGIRNKNKDLTDLAISHYLENGVLTGAFKDEISYEPINLEKAAEKYKQAFNEDVPLPSRSVKNDDEDESEQDLVQNSDEDLDQDSDNSNILKSKKSKHKRR